MSNEKFNSVSISSIEMQPLEHLGKYMHSTTHWPVRSEMHTPLVNYYRLGDTYEASEGMGSQELPWLYRVHTEKAHFK